MDLNATIRALRADRDRLAAVIAQLEALTQGKNGTHAAYKALAPRSPRGRKSMGAEERREVSARMKRYWASRRRARG
jgi:hypothetical protein